MIKCKKERCNLACLKERDRAFIIIERGKEKKDHQRGYISQVKIKIIVYSFFSQKENLTSPKLLLQMTGVIMISAAMLYQKKHISLQASKFNVTKSQGQQTASQWNRSFGRVYFSSLAILPVFSEKPSNPGTEHSCRP